MESRRITAVIAQDIRTGLRTKFRSRLFADCTGDGNLGFLANADFRVGRESKSQTQEDLAPESKDKLVMGTSVQWNSNTEETPSAFPACPWGVRFDENTCVATTKGDWNWETGADRDQVVEIEQIRDYALRIVFGNWSVLKNHPKFKERYAKRKLGWVAYIGRTHSTHARGGAVSFTMKPACPSMATAFIPPGWRLRRAASRPRPPCATSHGMPTSAASSSSQVGSDTNLPDLVTLSSLLASSVPIHSHAQ